MSGEQHESDLEFAKRYTEALTRRMDMDGGIGVWPNDPWEMAACFVAAVAVAAAAVAILETVVP